MPTTRVRLSNFQKMTITIFLMTNPTPTGWKRYCNQTVYLSPSYTYRTTTYYVFDETRCL